ncbi:MAG: prepilin-type N-terminal cleavage/methylation domain-containing protein [Lentisphaerae bacterium]|nr:prepilin-type N-terminal cleavage/methylation domain-containing protein [Lentisphaerota bacterium]
MIDFGEVNRAVQGRCDHAGSAAVRCAGMTLMELLVVIAILGLLMGLLLPGLAAARYAAHKARVRTEVAQIETAWKAFYDDYRALPVVGDMGAGAAGGVQILHGDETTFNTRQFRFMEFDDETLANGFTDKWGGLYRLALDSDGDGEVTAGGTNLFRSVAVWSLGRDGVEGTTDDIQSWQK